MSLFEEKCHHPGPSEKPLDTSEVHELIKEIPDWELKDNTIEHSFRFRDFSEAMDFVNRVAEIANAEDHHPDIHIAYNKVVLILTTHKIHGLSRNDFIMAAKTSLLMRDVTV
ncbi:MAG: 4a-hydroxytetrahydrobiopterin dehydratase [Sedimentisphaerales bacterium]